MIYLSSPSTNLIYALQSNAIDSRNSAQAQKTHCLRSITPMYSPIAVSCRSSSPRHFKLRITPHSGFNQATFPNPSVNSSISSPCSRAPNVHSFTNSSYLRLPVQDRTEQDPKVPTRAAQARPRRHPCPAPPPLSRSPLRPTRSQAPHAPRTPRTPKLIVCPSTPASPGRLVPPGVQGALRKEWRKWHHWSAMP